MAVVRVVMVQNVFATHQSLQMVSKSLDVMMEGREVIAADFCLPKLKTTTTERTLETGTIK